MTDSDRIQGKVAAILTLREPIINRGSADGVQIGMRFAVLNSQGVDVKDPDTGELLGSTEIVKTVVRLSESTETTSQLAGRFERFRGSPEPSTP